VDGIVTPHGELPLPAFLPDATRGTVRGVDPGDVAAAGIRGLVMNSLWLSQSPGASVIRAAGGLHRFSGWDGPIVTDSGGFQVYSLAALSDVGRDGFRYAFTAGDKRRLLTPEKAVETQVRLGADIVFCLDYCTHPNAPRSQQQESVATTLEWAARGRKAFDEMTTEPRPLLFSVVQGGAEDDLRRACAEELAAIGFDGYGFGGWPVAEGGGLVEEVALVASLLPEDKPRHALGVGTPENVARAHSAGYQLFDCALPSRNGRRGRVYVRVPGSDISDDKFSRVLTLTDERFSRDDRPIEEGCACPACARFSRAFLCHLFRSDDALGRRLATLHNLRFYADLTTALAQ